MAPKHSSGKPAKTAAKSKEPSQRQLRVGEEIRHILADMFIHRDFDEAMLRNVPITVTEVDVAPDLRNATAYVSPLTGAGQPTKIEKDIIDELNKHSGIFNREIAKKLVLKFSPRLKFSADNRFDYAERIETILNKVKQQEVQDD